MTAVLERPPLYRRPEEIRRRVIGFLLEFGIKAYGAAAALSVALSDKDTVGGKIRDAILAPPNLKDRYLEAKYLLDHRVEIQKAVNIVHQHAPDAAQLDTAVQNSLKTVDGIATMRNEVTQTKVALANTIDNISQYNFRESFAQASEAFNHVQKAWDAKPNLDSIRNLADEAQGVAAVLKELGVLDLDFARHYADLVKVMDNFASDEIAGTLAVMGAAFGLAYVLGMGAGFWARRGRPGFIAGTLQGFGARRFRGWYVPNLEYALSRPLYAVARERIQSDIVADPQKALGPEALQELERYFELRRREEPTASSGSVMATRPSK